MSRPIADPIEAFYERHPYPPPVADLGAGAVRLGDDASRRHAHHLIWPHRAPVSIRSVLVAGCGTSQAVRHALRHPHAEVVGIDVSSASIDSTRALAARHGITNLSVEQMALEDVGRLDARFDHVVCTGVLHHLADPALGLTRLGEALAPGGAVTLMVYARYGRTGVEMLQRYCRLLGIGTSAADIAELVAALREIPLGHPVSRLLRETPDFADDDALADALLNPRERSYSVPELLDLVEVAGLRFGRWERQAPYLPDRGSISETPHATRIAALPPAEQHAALELFRGTIVRHTAILCRADDARSADLDFGAPGVDRWVPVLAPTALAIEERLPPGAAAALINRAHSHTDLVRFVDRAALDVFRAIDGRRTIAELGPAATGVVEDLWRHDLVAIDATGAAP